MTKTKSGARGRGVNAMGRSKSDIQHFPLTYQMAKSAAWRSLSPAAVKVYIELRCRFHGHNNGEITLSMDEGAALLHMSKSTVKRALEELKDKGFIKRTRRGQWLGRIASTYAVTNVRLNGNEATNDWKAWRPDRPLHKGEDNDGYGHIRV